MIYFFADIPQGTPLASRGGVGVGSGLGFAACIARTSPSEDTRGETSTSRIILTPPLPLPYKGGEWLPHKVARA